jgi:2-oxo-4-hydroxy-4-carboxy--5-ureidoimidazoline (OHCU) decarboxylase
MGQRSEAEKLADLMVQEWISAYSDNGAIWATAAERLRKAKEAEAQQVIDEALKIARDRWELMHHAGS